MDGLWDHFILEKITMYSYNTNKRLVPVTDLDYHSYFVQIIINI